MNRSTIYILFLLLPLVSSFSLRAQDDSRSNKSLLLRGKASGFVIIEDVYFTNLNIGLEYRFAERHSFGVDFVHFRWRYEHDIYIDGMETGSGPDSFSRRQYMLVDYRYYPFRYFMKNFRIDPYVNPFVKMGKRKVWTNDPNTFFEDNDLSSIRNQRADFTDYGFALGLRFDFGSRDQFGLDANIGAVYRETRILYEEQFDVSSSQFVERFSGKDVYWKPHMRLNLFYRLCKMY